MKLSAAVSHESKTKLNDGGLTFSRLAAQEQQTPYKEYTTPKSSITLGSKSEIRRRVVPTPLLMSYKKKGISKITIPSHGSCGKHSRSIITQKRTDSQYGSSTIGRSLLTDRNSNESRCSHVPGTSRLVSNPYLSRSLHPSSLSSLRPASTSFGSTVSQYCLNVVPQHSFSGIFKAATSVTVRTNSSIKSHNSAKICSSENFHPSRVVPSSHLDALGIPTDNIVKSLFTENTQENFNGDDTQGEQPHLALEPSIKNTGDHTKSLRFINSALLKNSTYEQIERGDVGHVPCDYGNYAEGINSAHMCESHSGVSSIIGTSESIPGESRAQPALCTPHIRSQSLRFSSMCSERDASGAHHHYRQSTSLTSIRTTRSHTTPRNCRGRHNSIGCSQGLIMAQPLETGPYTTLWVSAQDGSIEVRSMANLRTIIATIPKMPKSTFVTSLLCIGLNRVAAGQSDGRIRIFDACTLKELQELNAHIAAITCMTIAMLPITFPICSASPQQTDKNDSSGTEPMGAASGGSVAVILTGSLDCTIGVWDSKTLTLVSRLEGNRSGVSALTASVCGCYAVSGSVDGIIRLWNLLTNTQVKLEEGERQALVCHQKLSTPKGGLPRRKPPEKVDSTPKRSAKDGQYSLFSCSAAYPGIASHSVLTQKRIKHGKIVKERSSRYVAKQKSLGGSIFSARFFPDAKSGEKHNITRSSVVPGTCFTPLRTPIRQTKKYNADNMTKSCHLSKPKPKKPNFVKITEIATTALHHSEEHLRMLTSNQNFRVSYPNFYFPCCHSSDKDFENPCDFNWPIDNAHRDLISGLVVVQDRLLVTASRDGTAKVFGLPSGVFLRCLAVPSKTPLSTVFFDRQQCRLLLGVTDGTLLVYDLLSEEMPMVLQAKLPVISLSSVYVPLYAFTMKRFFLVSGTFSPYQRSCDQPVGVSSSDMVSVKTLAQMDLTTMAQDPVGRPMTHRVGELSPRELYLAAQQSDLQAKVQGDKVIVSKVSTMGTLEDMQLEHMRQNALVMQRVCTRVFFLRYFLALQRWSLRKQFAAKKSSQPRPTLIVFDEYVIHNYWVRWRLWCRKRSKRRWSNAVVLLQSRGHYSRVGTKNIGDHCGFRKNQDTCALTHQRICFAVIAYRHHVFRQDFFRNIFCQWATASRTRLILKQREYIFNRLFQSFSTPFCGTSGTPQIRLGQETQCRGQHLQLLSLIHYLCEPSRQLLRWSYYSQWRKLIIHQQEQIGERETNAVSLLSRGELCPFLLVRSGVLQMTCFRKWRIYALYVAKIVRFKEEKYTMHREWMSLQSAINASSLEQLRAEELELERCVIHTTSERESLKAAERTAREEVTAMQISEAMSILLGSFLNVPLLNHLITNRTTSNQLQTQNTKGYGSGGRCFINRANSQLDAATEARPPCVHHLFGIGAHLSIPPHNNHHHSASFEESIADNSIISNATDERQSLSVATICSTTGRLNTSSFHLLQAVLLTLKGGVFHCSRDRRALVVAHNLTVRLHIFDLNATAVTANNLVDSDDTYGSRYTRNTPNFGQEYRRGGAGFRPSHSLAMEGFPHQGRQACGGVLPWSVMMTNRLHWKSLADVNSRDPPALLQDNNHDAHSRPQTDSHIQGGEYKTLAEAFDSITQELITVLGDAIRGAGISEKTALLPILASNGSFDYDRGFLPLYDDEAIGPIEPHNYSQTPPIPSPFHIGYSKQHVPSSSSLHLCVREKYDCTSDLHQQIPQASQSPLAERETQALHKLVQRPAHALQWIRLISSKLHHQIMTLVVKLIVLYDSFIAHSEMSFEGANGISTRGSSTVCPLSASCLCSDSIAALLIQHAAPLLMLLHNKLWEQQIQLKALAETYTKPISMSFEDAKGGNDGLGSANFGDSYSPDLQDTFLNTYNTIPGSSCASSLESSFVQSTSLRLQHTPFHLPQPQLRLSNVIDSKGRTSQLSGCRTASCDRSQTGESLTNGGTRSHWACDSVSSARVTTTQVTPKGGTMNVAVHRPRTPSRVAFSGEDDLDVEEVFSRRSHDTFNMSTRCGTPHFTSQHSASFSSCGIVKPYLGFCVTVNRDVNNSTRISIKEVISTYMTPDGEEVKSPASMAGLKAGDRIVRFAGYAVTDLAAFNAIVSRHSRVGVELQIEVVRDWEVILLSIKVGSKLSSQRIGN